MPEWGICFALHARKAAQQSVRWGLNVADDDMPSGGATEHPSLLPVFLVNHACSNGCLSGEVPCILPSPVAALRRVKEPSFRGLCRQH